MFPCVTSSLGEAQLQIVNAAMKIVEIVFFILMIVQIKSEQTKWFTVTILFSAMTILSAVFQPIK